MRETMIALLMTLTVATAANAQPRKSSAPTTPPPAVSYTNYSTGENEITALLGFAAGAVNIGVDYAHMNNGAGFGGYFFMQSEKTTNNQKIVSQTMSFGGHYKMNIVDNNRFTGYFAPGAGLTLAKEVGINTSGKSSDETLLGLSYKIGATIKITPAFSLGVERTAITNWFNDKVPFAAFEYFSVAGVITF